MESDAVIIGYYNDYLSGNDESLGIIIREYRDQLLWFVLDIVKNFHDAEEVVSDTFVSIAMKKKRFRGDSQFKTYIYAIGHNKAVDLVRKRERRGEVPAEENEDESDFDLLETQILKTERDRHLHDAINELCEDYRKILYLIYFEEMTAEEAGHIMKKSRKQAENLIFRARNALRAILIKEGYEYEEL